MRKKPILILVVGVAFLTLMYVLLRSGFQTTSGFSKTEFDQIAFPGIQWKAVPLSDTQCENVSGLNFLKRTAQIKLIEPPSSFRTKFQTAVTNEGWQFITPLDMTPTDELRFNRSVDGSYISLYVNVSIENATLKLIGPADDKAC